MFEVTLPSNDPLAQQMSQYEPFRLLGTDQKPAFRLQVVAERPAKGEFVREIHQDDDGSEILAGSVDGHPCFDFLLCGNGRRVYGRMMRIGRLSYMLKEKGCSD